LPPEAARDWKRAAPPIISVLFGVISRNSETDYVVEVGCAHWIALRVDQVKMGPGVQISLSLRLVGAHDLGGRLLDIQLFGHLLRLLCALYGRVKELLPSVGG
jgi:hypothetical protein